MADNRPSGFDLACSGLFGAVLGVVAIIVGAMIADIVPEIAGVDAEVCGVVWFLLVLALVLSAAVRLIAAVFSTSIRGSIKVHPVSHAIWFGAALGMTLFILALPRIKTKLSFRESPNEAAPGNGAMTSLFDSTCPGRSVPEPRGYA